MNTAQIISVQLDPTFLAALNSRRNFVVIDDTPHSPAAHSSPVEPIRDRADIERIKKYFLAAKGHGTTNLRNYAYFILSINLARRAGDMLGLHVYDILNPDGTFKSHVVFGHEQKTGKRSVLPLDSSSREALTLYFNARTPLRMSDWLFPATGRNDQPLSVDGARRMLQRTVAALNLDIHIGTHSLRKTKPYHMIKDSHSTEDEVMVSQFLGHSNVRTTYHYIGRSQAEMDKFIAAHSF